MAWKLCIAVLALQVAYLQADSHDISMADMVHQMMSQQRETNPGDMLRQYLEQHGLGGNVDHGRKLVEELLQIMETEVTIYQQLQTSDLVTKSVIEALLSEEQGLNDFAKHLVMQQIKSTVQPADDSKIILGMLFNYLMQNPKSEKRETVMQLLYHVTAQQSHDDKNMLRVMMMHLVNIAYGEQKDLAVELFLALLSDDLGGKEIKPREMILLFVQHLMYRLAFDREKHYMGVMMLHGLSKREDCQAQAMLRDFITKIILHWSYPTEIEENDTWKYLPPGPCHVADLSGSTVYDRDCPEDYECNTQAIQYDFQGRSLNYHMCQYPSEKLEYFAYHACEVTYPGDIVEARPNCAGACDFGPFSATVDGLIYQAKFCSDYSNYTFNASGLDMAVLTACALVDPTSAMRPVQRKCPSGQACIGIPKWVEVGQYTLQAIQCRNAPQYKDDLLMNLLNAVLGYEEDEENSGADNMMMGGERVANMSSVQSNFEEFVIIQLWEMVQKQRENNEEMDQQSEDEMNWNILNYLVERVAPEDHLMTRFLHTLEMKSHLCILTNADRVLAHSVAADLMTQFYEMQQSDDRRDGAAVRRLLDMLRGHAAEHAALKEALGDHKDEHDKVNYNMQQLYQMILASQGGGHDNKQDDHSHDDMGLDEMQVLLEFLRRISMTNGDK